MSHFLKTSNLKKEFIDPEKVSELLKQLKIDKLVPGEKYQLYLNKKPYDIIVREDGKISIPNVKACKNYIKEELPSESNGYQRKVEKSSSENIDTWFEPEMQILVLSENNVYQKELEEGGHIPLITIFSNGKPAKRKLEKTTISVHIEDPWTFKSYEPSGNVKITKNDHDILVEGDGSIQLIKLKLN